MGLKKSKQQVYFVHNEIKNSNYLENLSNELIYEVFDYLSFHDISFAFGNLNQRFQNLIDTHLHYINLQQHTQDNIQPLPRHIRSLKINAHYQLSFINFLNICSLHDLIVSNLRIFSLLHIFNTLSLKELEYVYLGSCASYHEFDEKQLAEIQKKILLLNESKLKKCVFRMKLLIDINQLPLKLSSLEYLRIDGCENILIVHNLLNRMPNLKSLRISIFESIQMNNIKNQYSKENNKNNCLTNLIIRIHNLNSPEEFIPLFIQHCSNVKRFIIYLNPIKECISADKISDIRFVNRYQWTINIINQYLPQLTNFHLRQCVHSQNFDFLNRSCYFLPYIENISCSLNHRSYRVSIAGHLATVWQNTA